jgi:peptide/nickel transport system substrate-binding protein
MSPTGANVSNVSASTPANAIYGFLGYIDGETGKVVLQFLKSMTPSSDLKTWTLVLHPNIKFSDGTPMNAAAIEYNLKKLGDPAGGATNYKDIGTWTEQVVDDLTLKITLPSPDGQFPSRMTQYFPFIGSPTAWDKAGDKFATQPVGAGPFMVQSWTQNVSMVLVKNPYYKDFAPGQPYLDKFVVTVTAGQSQFMASLSSGQGDGGFLQGQTQLDQVKALGFNVSTAPINWGGGNRVLFNMSKAPTNNLKVRQAISYALNRAEFANVWAPGTPPFTNLFSTTSPYYDKNQDFLAQSPDKAKQLFAEAAAAGANLTFTFLCPDTYPQLGAYMQATLEKYAGVKVKLALENQTQYLKDMAAGNFDMATYGMYYATPWPTVQQYFAKDGGLNYGKWSDPKVDSALAAIAATTDANVLKTNYQTIAAELNSQLPFFGVQATQLGFAFAKNVQGAKVVQTGAVPLPALLWLK